MIGMLGEALIDLISGKGTDGQECFYPYPGGCALNTAVAASRLGASVLYLGKLSSDMFGEQMQRYFIQNGVFLKESWCRCKENSMIGFAKLDANGAASYAFYSEGTTPTALNADEIVSVLQRETNLHFLHIGSVSLALDIPGAQILNALKTFTKRPFIFLDPNVRSSAITDFGTYRKRMAEIFSVSDLIKLSDEDLELLFPQVPEEQAIGMLLSGGTSHVVLTRGRNGLSWFSASGFTCRQKAKEVLVVDTVGAGDTVSGAILAYLERHGLDVPSHITLSDARTALAFASAAAAVTCSRKGCNPPMQSEIVM
ncbi:MAG: PfkB family carbohydrate kinase [Sphaerochaetaceae bacterium]